jgi:hypothetical protein
MFRSLLDRGLNSSIQNCACNNIAQWQLALLLHKDQAHCMAIKFPLFCLQAKAD